MFRFRVGRFPRFVRTVAAGAVTVALAGCDAPRPESAPRAAPPDAAVAPAAAAPRAGLAGTWRLERVERRDQNGDPLPEFVHRGIGQGAALGYLMYDGEHVGMVVQREAAAALDAAARYTAYFGRYALDEPEGYVTHRIVGSLDPNLAGSETQLRYELAEDHLVLTPPLRCPDSFVTERGCGYGTTGIRLRNVWERVGAAPDAGPEARALLGFWEIDRIARRTADGVEVPAEQYAEGYLMYMPSGHMALQLMRAGRSPYRGSSPTPSEVEASRRSYVSSFGTFRVLPDEGVVVHHRTGHLDRRNVGSDARRAFTLREGQLLLEPPATTGERGTVRTTVFWNRLGARTGG